MSAPLPDPEEAIHARGPWRHRTVSANGARFHIAEMGEGPLVLLLHGFPMYWYTWRGLLPVLADQGFRAVAMDLRGYGTSDHTPHGYDPLSLAADVTGVIRSLGSPDAVVVGHGWGGLLAWTLAAVAPETVRGIVPAGVPHPRRLRESLLHDRHQRRAARYVYGLQVPFAPERSLTRDGAERIERLLRQWSHDDTWLDDGTAALYRAAMLFPATAHCAIEYHRWALRSIPRRDGRAYVAALAPPIAAPVLHVHGRRDPAILLSSVEGSHEHVSGAYALRVLEAGHVVHEEAPREFAGLVTGWLSEGMAWQD